MCGLFGGFGALPRYSREVGAVRRVWADGPFRGGRRSREPRTGSVLEVVFGLGETKKRPRQLAMVDHVSTVRVDPNPTLSWRSSEPTWNVTVRRGTAIC